MSSHSPYLYIKHALHSTITSQVVKVPPEFITNSIEDVTNSQGASKVHKVQEVQEKNEEQGTHSINNSNQVMQDIETDKDVQPLYTILNHGTHIRIYEMWPHGLNVFRDYSLNCVVSSLNFIDFNGKSHLLLLTQEKNILILKWNGEDLEIVAQGSASDRVGRLSIRGDKIRVLPKNLHFNSPSLNHSSNTSPNSSNGVLMSLFEGILKYLYVDPKTSKICTENIIVNEIDLIDFTCIQGSEQQNSGNVSRRSEDSGSDLKILIAVLYRDSNASRFVKIYEFSPQTVKLEPSIDFVDPFLVDPQSTSLLALPSGGLIVFGGKTINLLPLRSKSEAACAVHFEQPTQVTASAYYQNGDYFVGTVHGNLFKLHIQSDRHETKMELKLLGEISTPTDIEYLGDGFIYVASICADSQIIQYNEDENQISVYEEFENIAPIMDATIVDFGMHGQGAMITCSGKGKDGSLRIIINGVSIEPVADTPLEEATTIFSLSSINTPNMNEYLVLSFPSETMVLGFPEDELDRVDIGFDLTVPTIACGTNLSGKYVQVTRRAVLLIDPTQKRTIFEWKPKSESEILISKIYKDFILLSTGHNLVFLRTSEDQIHLVSETKRDNLVSCIDITENLCAVGNWNTYTVDLLNLPDFVQIDSHVLKDNILPRSLLFSTFEGINYLLAGLGDGTLFYFILDREQISLSDGKKIIIGTKPISLHSFVSHNEEYVFASSDRATIIFSQHKKLLFSNVNMKDLIGLCSFNHEKVPNGLGLITPDALTIGQITEIQNIQVKKVPLHCQPVKIAFDEVSATVGVLTISSNNSRDVNHFQIFQANTFESLDKYLFQEYEYGSSIACVKLTGMESPCYVVGTSIVHPEDREPRQGKIYIFEINDDRLRLLHSAEVKGAVYSIASITERGLLLTAVNSKVHLWIYRDESLHLTHTFLGQLLCLSIKTRGDFVIVGDLIRSVTVLRYDPQNIQLEEIARDCTNIYTTASLILDDDNYLIVDNAKNAVVMTKNQFEEVVRRLGISSRYHLGESVNTICEGSLKMNIDFPEMRTFAYGSSNGAVGIIATISPQQYHMFQKVQSAMEQFSGNSLGNLHHAEFRAYRTRNKIIASEGFIDGDFLESFLGMDSGLQEQIASHVQISLKDITTEIDRMSRALV